MTVTSSREEVMGEEVTYTVTVEPEDAAVRGASGDKDIDRACETYILGRLRKGDVWAWACVRVTASYKGFEGDAILGCCCYKDEEDFRAGPSYQDMRAEALANLKVVLALAVKCGRGEERELRLL